MKSGYAGFPSQNKINSEGVESNHGGVMQPFQGCKICPTTTQRSRCAPTLGWMMESRWDSERRRRGIFVEPNPKMI
jgi:hypothetical protein